MYACQDNVSTDLEESLDLFAGLEEIPEASQSSVTINKGADESTDGYFTISLDNVSANPSLAPGVHEAWCMEWQKSLRSNGDVHDNVKWYDTAASSSWKPLNYFFSIRKELRAADPELTYRDIQAVVWVLAGKMGIAPEFNALTLSADRIPSRLRSNGEVAFSREKVARIARRVMQEAPGASISHSGVVAQTAADEQDIFVPPNGPDDKAFVTTWNTELGPGTTVTLALGYNLVSIIGFDFDVTGNLDATIDWGDGTDPVTATDGGPYTHEYAKEGIYTISVTGIVSEYNNDSFGSKDDIRKLTSVDSWGDIGFESLSRAFIGAENLTSVPNHTSGLENVTRMDGMFEGATSFNAPLDNWDVSNVTDMQSMFFGASSFNQPIDDWNVSKVKSMRSMFAKATSFNQPLNSWDVSSVWDMGEIFISATSFNQPLDNWDVSGVTIMHFMFDGASSFNQPLNNWDVSKVTTMVGMFGGAFGGAISFNQPLDKWDVSGVTNMFGMFSAATSFNQDLSGWCVEQISSQPSKFDDGATSWVLPRPDWGAPCTP